jgi:hypothetical protein
MDITREYFDEQFSKLTKEVAGIKEVMATKDDLTALESRITESVDRKIDDLARMVQDGFADVAERLDVREQLEQHERDIESIKRALKLA